jgi:hypothetical protein
MEFREVYCNNCKKILGRFNSKFYTEEKIEVLLKIEYSIHVKKGHQIFVRKLKKSKLN